MTSCTFKEWRELHHNAHLLQTFFTVTILTLLVIVIIAGNLLVIIAVMMRRRLRTATGMLILSLAVADLLVCFMPLLEQIYFNYLKFQFY